MNSKRVELVWDNHLQNISDIFKVLYEDDYLVDVTLFCQDGYIKTHKLVLSACSPYFRQIFEVNPCKHPTIVLQEVPHRNMTALVEYMYKGIINIPSENLTAIIRLARDLKIKGFDNIKNIDNLANNDNNNDDIENERLMNLVPACILNESNENNPVLTDSNLYRTSNHKKSCTSDSSDSADTLLKVAHEEPITEKDLMGSVKDESMTDTDSNDSDKTYVNPMHQKIFYSCNDCQKKFATKRQMKKHKRTHTGKLFKCDLCQEGFSRTSQLMRHRKIHAGERVFNCGKCGKPFTREDKLKLHVCSNFNILAYSTEPPPLMPLMHSNHDVVPRYVLSHAPTEIPRQQLVLNAQNAPISTITNPVQIKPSLPALPEGMKRKRGRPRKYPPKFVDPWAPKRGRGRPRKDAPATQRHAIFGDMNYFKVSSLESATAQVKTETAATEGEEEKTDNPPPPKEPDVRHPPMETIVSNNEDPLSIVTGQQEGGVIEGNAQPQNAAESSGNEPKDDVAREVETNNGDSQDVVVIEEDSNPS